MAEKTHTRQKKHHILYKTTCMVNGKFYIGMHSTDDLNDGYLGSGKRLLRSVKKHGERNHHREIIEHFSNRKILRDREKELVTEDLIKDSLCMNICKGGFGLARFMPDATKEKISSSKKGKSSWNKGVPMSEETKKKLSASKKGQGLGEKRSEETCFKQSIKAKEREARKKAEGYVISAETKRKMSVSKMGKKNHFYGRKHSEETKRKISETKRAHYGR